MSSTAAWPAVALTFRGTDASANDVAPVAVGRMPARTAAELKRLVAETIGCELGDWSGAAKRLALLIRHPGGNSSLERRLAESIANTAAGQLALGGLV